MELCSECYHCDWINEHMGRCIHPGSPHTEGACFPLHSRTRGTCEYWARTADKIMPNVQATEVKPEWEGTKPIDFTDCSFPDDVIDWVFNGKQTTEDIIDKVNKLRTNEQPKPLDFTDLNLDQFHKEMIEANSIIEGFSNEGIHKKLTKKYTLKRKPAYTVRLCETATEIALMCGEKAIQYGDSFTVVSQMLKVLRPDGFKADELHKALFLARLLDKVVRYDTDTEGDTEDPLSDIIGYCLRELVKP